MPSEEHTRSDLFRALGSVLGEEAASAIMERLPPKPWTEIASKSDLEELRTHMDARFGEFEQRLRADAEEREQRLVGHVEVAEQRLRADAELREERITGSLRGEINALLTSHTKTIAFTLLGAIAAHSAALIAALRLD